MNKLLWPAAAGIAILATHSAQAQLIDDVDFRREGVNAVLQIRFVTPVQFRLALVGKSNDVAQAFYDIGANGDPSLTGALERRVVGGGAMPDIVVTDEGTGRETLGRKILLRLSQPVKFKIRAGRSDRSIEVVLEGLAGAIPRSEAMSVVAPPPPASGFRISLLQSDTPNLQLDAAIPSSLQRYEVFTGQSVDAGKALYEISVGYFTTLVEAEAARQALLQRFPAAAVIALAPNPSAKPAAPTPPAAPAAAVVAVAPLPLPVVPAPAASAPAGPPTAEETEARAAALLASARAVEAQQDHATALDRLYELLNLPANSSTRAAQEMVGDVRARAGDPTRARAEYNTFLSLFPTGPDADRVRAALARLPADAPKPPPEPVVAAAPSRPKVEPTSTLSGSFYEAYSGGASNVRTQDFIDSPVGGVPVQPTDETKSGTDQKQLQSNVDVNWRYRDTDSDMRFVFRDGYSADLLNDGKNRNRLSALYFEHRSLRLGTSIKLGRQSPTGGGVFNRYDGAQGSYTFAPKWRVSAAAGVPTDKLYDTKRHFYGTWIDADALTSHLGATLYFNRQMIDGQVDRSAIGTDVRYFNGGVSLLGTLDYDQPLRSMNIASLQGTWQLEGNSVVNFQFDKRKTTLLTLSNALIFQFQQPAVTTINELLATQTIDQLRNGVRATSSDTTQALLGGTVPVNKTWQVGGNLRLADVGEVPPVPEILFAGQGRNKNDGVDLQLIGSNLYSERDTHVLSLSILRGSSYTLALPATSTTPATDATVSSYNGKLLSYNNSSQLTELLLLEPSLKYYIQNESNGAKTTRWSPGLRLTYRAFAQFTVSSDLNGEFSKATRPTTNASGTGTTTESSRRISYSLSGRYDF